MTDLDAKSWALRYAAGALPVLPLHSIQNHQCSCGHSDCHSPGKHPITIHGKDDATSDPEQIESWWRRYRWANVGIRPPVGTVVLDVDPRNSGDEELLNLTRQHGELPQTLIARTGSGGLHIWLAHAGPARGRLCRGVDVKTNRGYLVAPPSIHLSGGRYEWLSISATAPAPGWVRDRLNPPLPAYKNPTCPGGNLDALLGVIAADPGGELNNRLYWASCRAHEYGLDTEPLVELAISMGHPPRGAFNTAASAAKAPPRQVGAAR